LVSFLWEKDYRDLCWRGITLVQIYLSWDEKSSIPVPLILSIALMKQIALLEVSLFLVVIITPD